MRRKFIVEIIKMDQIEGKINKRGVLFIL